MTEPVTLTSATPRLGLPLLHVAQAHKEASVNEALLRADALLHTAVLGEATTPPASPQPGDSWIVKAPASGAWTGAEGSIASYSGGLWHIVPAMEGMRVFDSAVGCFARFSESTWHRAARPAAPAGGTTADAEARNAIAELVAVLVTAGILPPA